MKKYLATIILMLMPLMGMAQSNYVFISTSEMATSYHKTKECYHLKKSPIEMVTETKAKEMGRNKCSRCYESIVVKDNSTVYVCTGGSSKKYHASRDCHGLSSCKGEIKSMTPKEAEKLSKEPCKVCIR